MENIISFNDWQKLDLRVAQIKNVEDIENADKLYKLTLDVGNEIGERIVCAGIKQYYTKKELKGKKIIVFTNLAPRVMKGITSEGMILAAESDAKNSQENFGATKSARASARDSKPDFVGDKSQVVLLSPEENCETGSKVNFEK